MSNVQQSFNAGQTQGQTQAKTEQVIQSTKDAANAARDKAENATQSAQESAQQGQEQTAGFLQQTGAQVKGMAQGAVESVKNTLGMNESK
ncbi:hypothetical protein DITRI_Ditri15bG0109700 [Diplodiscus trichospermus]